MAILSVRGLWAGALTIGLLAAPAAPALAGVVTANDGRFASTSPAGDPPTVRCGVGQNGRPGASGVRVVGKGVAAGNGQNGRPGLVNGRRPTGGDAARCATVQKQMARQGVTVTADWRALLRRWLATYSGPRPVVIVP